MWKGKEDGRPSSKPKKLQTSVPMPNGGGKAPEGIDWRGQDAGGPSSAPKTLKKG